MLLSEVHYTDLYPASFQAFRKKYLPLVRQGRGDLYVQFTNFADNVMTRSAHPSPDHSDMVGVYGYPLRYVLTHPADIWYGMGARYLRVLQNHARRTLNLAVIQSESAAINMMQRMGFHYRDAETSLAIARKHYKARTAGTNRWGKLFLTAVQVDLLSEPSAPGSRGMFGYTPPAYRMRTGIEQTALFRKAGYDAIQETGRTNRSAILNDREPEQIVFLHRGAFRVIEVVNLRAGVPKTDLPTMTTSDPATPRIERPFAQMIAKAMDDTLKEGGKRGIDYGKYWTRNGSRIEIKFERQQSYYQDRKIGEKKHREDKLFNSYGTRLSIDGPKGRFSRYYPPEEKFRDIAEDVVRWWHGAEPMADWQPEDRAGYEAKQKAADHAALLASLKAKEEKRIAELPQFFAEIDWVAEHLGLPKFQPNANYELNNYLLDNLGYLRLPDNADDAVITERLSWVRDNAFGPRTEPLLEQWDQLARIIQAAWEQVKHTDRKWLFLRGGAGLFKNTRFILDPSYHW